MKLLGESVTNPFIQPDEWQAFLESRLNAVYELIATDKVPKEQ